MNQLEESINRQQLIRAAILLAAGQNSNMPGHAKRLLLQRYGINAYECEIEVECAQLVTDTLRDVSRLIQAASPKVEG